jgi:hypothetical protein
MYIMSAASGEKTILPPCPWRKVVSVSPSASGMALRHATPPTGVGSYRAPKWSWRICELIPS